MSAGTKWSSPDHPAAFTNKPFKQICQYMRQLPEHGYVLSTFTNQQVEYNWPKPMIETGAYTCHSKDTVTAQCDGAVCQVMDEETWTPKLNKADWKAGDPAVCTCPTVKGPEQTIAGSLMADGECYANGAGHPDGPSCVPKQTSEMNTYEVMVGAMSGGIPELDALIASCGAEDVQTPICGGQKPEPHSPKPVDIAPCEPGQDCPAGSCGQVAPGHPCEAPGWVFCLDAVCDEPSADRKTGKLISKCKCWQPTNTNSSVLPAASNSGANCVMGTGPGGNQMCEAIKGGALISTWGPTGNFLPGKKPRMAICRPHTPWSWCWGAPCQREANGDITCDCPMMVSTNDDDQSLFLIPSECPSDSNPDVNPCTMGVYNSNPAGSNLGSVGYPECYSYVN